MTNTRSNNNADQQPMTLDELAKLGERGVSIVATGRAFNPNLHPRGKDGKFIEKFGFIKFVLDGKLMRGQVVDIRERSFGGRRSSSLTVRVDGKSGKRGDASFVEIDPKTATQAEPDKARLNKLAIADIDNALEWDPDNATGYGYNTLRQNFEVRPEDADTPDGIRKANRLATYQFTPDDIDAMVVARANESGMSYKNLAEWLNSRDARFFSDELTDVRTKAEAQKILDKYLPKPADAKPTAKKPAAKKNRGAAIAEAYAKASANDGFSRQAEIDELWRRHHATVNIDDYGRGMSDEDKLKMIELLEEKEREVGLGGMSDRATLDIMKSTLGQAPAKTPAKKKAAATPKVARPNLANSRARAARNDMFSRQAEIDAIWQKYADGPDDYGRSMTPEDRGQLIALLEAKQTEVGLGGMSDAADLASLKRFQRLYPDGPAGPAGGDKISVVSGPSPLAGTDMTEIARLTVTPPAEMTSNDAEFALKALNGPPGSDDAMRRELEQVLVKYATVARSQSERTDSQLVTNLIEIRSALTNSVNDYSDVMPEIDDSIVQSIVGVESANMAGFTSSAELEQQLAELRARVHEPVVASLRARVHPPKAVVASAADELRARVHGPTAVTAASRPWNKNLHPRGKDGKFIEKLGFVKFASGVGRKQDKGKVIGVKKGKNKDGMILSIEKDDGTIVEKMPSEVSTTPAPKASIDKKSSSSASMPSKSSESTSKLDPSVLPVPQLKKMLVEAVDDLMQYDEKNGLDFDKNYWDEDQNDPKVRGHNDRMASISKLARVIERKDPRTRRSDDAIDEAKAEILSKTNPVEVSVGDKVTLKRPQSPLGTPSDWMGDSDMRWKEGSKGTISEVFEYNGTEFVTVKMSTSRNGSNEFTVKKSQVSNLLDLPSKSDDRSNSSADNPVPKIIQDAENARKLADASTIELPDDPQDVANVANDVRLPGDKVEDVQAIINRLNEEIENGSFEVTPKSREWSDWTTSESMSDPDGKTYTSSFGDNKYTIYVDESSDGDVSWILSDSDGDEIAVGDNQYKSVQDAMNDAMLSATDVIENDSANDEDWSEEDVLALVDNLQSMIINNSSGDGPELDRGPSKEQTDRAALINGEGLTYDMDQVDSAIALAKVETDKTAQAKLADNLYEWAAGVDQAEASDPELERIDFVISLLDEIDTDKYAKKIKTLEDLVADTRAEDA